MENIRQPIELRDFALRRAVATDYPAIAGIDRMSFDLPWSEQTYRAELEDNQHARYIVAYVDAGQSPTQTLIGFAGYHRVIDEAEMMNLAVVPDWRGRGVGRALMRQLIAWAREERLLRFSLEVNEINRQALALYCSLGFQEAGRRKQYYRVSGTDALIMELRL